MALKLDPCCVCVGQKIPFFPSDSCSREGATGLLTWTIVLVLTERGFDYYTTTIVSNAPSIGSSNHFPLVVPVAFAFESQEVSILFHCSVHTCIWQVFARLLALSLLYVGGHPPNQACLAWLALESSPYTLCLDTHTQVELRRLSSTSCFLFTVLCRTFALEQHTHTHTVRGGEDIYQGRRAISVCTHVEAIPAVPHLVSLREHVHHQDAFGHLPHRHPH